MWMWVLNELCSIIFIYVYRLNMLRYLEKKKIFSVNIELVLEINLRSWVYYRVND